MFSKPIKVATDCSGMEAPIQALKNLRANVSHVFACDVNEHVRATIEANFAPKVMYEDLLERNNTAAGSCDVYVAGFPCQPFSLMGSQQGFKDKEKRGIVFFGVLDYIKKQLPKVVIIENVRGLQTISGGKYFKAIIKKLEGIGRYNIQHRVLNTKEHGVPQNRPRVYMVCIRSDVDDGSFVLGDLQPLDMPSIENFLDKRKPSQAKKLPPKSNGNGHRNVKMHMAAIRKEGDNPEVVPYIIDDGSTAQRSTAKKDCCPCITRRRGAGHWVSNRGRRLLKTEMARLQGMDPTRFVVAVRPFALGEQLGNTMSVNVLERLFSRILPAAGLAKRGKPLSDRWENGRALEKLKATRNRGFKRYTGDALVAQDKAKQARTS